MLNLETGPDPVTISTTMRGSLIQRIERHMVNSKYLKKEANTQQKWVLNAIKEKLNQEIEPVSAFPKKTVTVWLPKNISEKMNLRIDQVSKLKNKKITKREFIMNAIEEKLNQEEPVFQKEVRAIFE